MFLQIHTLTSHHAALLNRDDAGLAKRIPFGDSERMRVSSQCLKRHWRLALKNWLDMPAGIRSRHFFEREVKRRAVAGGVDEATAEELTVQIIKKVIASKDNKDKEKPLFLKQPVLFGKPEADYFVALVKECAANGEQAGDVLDQRLKAEKQNFRAMLRAAGGNDLASGLEGAMFGRFVTSDILARTDASVHVAHAFTVHPLRNEVDYFTVVDDLKDDGEDAGAAHAGDMELGAGVFYGYVVVDVPLLVSNLTGCDRADWQGQQEGRADAARVIDALVRAIATVSPGAKLGSTAPYARADFVLLEAGSVQPRSLSNSYLSAIRPRGDVMQEAVDALGKHLGQLDGMYGVEEQRFVATTRNPASVPGAGVADLAGATRQALASVVGDA